MQSVSQLFDQAFQYHQAGNLHQAELLYRQILQIDPLHVNALHLFGLIAQQVGRNDLALDYIQRALRLHSQFPAAHYNLANTFRELGRFDEAVRHFQEAIRLEPHNANAHNHLGHILKSQGKRDAAIASLRQALRLKPDLAEAYNTLANALREQGKVDEALANYGQALRYKPDYAEAHNNLGVVLQEQGKHAEASAHFQQALRLKPDLVAAHNNLGNSLREQENFAEAIACYQQALRLKPDFADVYNNLGNVFRDMGRLDEAVANYEEILRRQPHNAEAHFNLCLALQDQGRFDEALSRCQEALRLRPDFAESYNTLGSILRNQGKLEEAVAAYRQALRLKPEYAEAYNNLGVVLQDLGKFDEAMASQRQALRSKPDYADAHFNLATQLLTLANFTEGWEHYAWRWRSKAFRSSSASKQSVSQMAWDGSPLQGRTILMQAEQGLGDTIQFARYAALLKEQGAGKILLACPPELLGLMRHCRGIDQIVTETPFPPFDVGAFLVSLPGLLGATSVERIPANVPYLDCDPERIERWEARLTALDVRRPVRRVGIAWQGKSNHKGDRWRSVPLEQFAPLAQLPGVRLISLQKGHGREQLEKLPGVAVDLGPELNEVADTAAVIRCLDLVITVDTAIAHLAGALAAPVWLALPMVPDWRWLLEREDSPWYPTMRLFRNTHIGPWDEVFGSIKSAVDAFAVDNAARTSLE
jgi:tetratricopeptide (TPR) repeat protein